MKKKVLIVTVFIGIILNGFCQSNPVWYVAQIKDDREIMHIYDSLKQPLFIIDKNVYSISPNCITKALAADANDRDLGGSFNNRNNSAASNNRRDSGDANDRSNTGSANDRKLDGGAADRPNGGGRNNRDYAGDANQRNNTGNANDRNNTGQLLSFYCAIDKKQKLVLYFKKISQKDHPKIYYGHSFFNSKYFKIHYL